jgi:hypothetical protein
MAKFFGKIGYSESTDNGSGVWEDVIVEYEYYGDVLRNTRKLSEGGQVNADLSVNNAISVVANAYANEHFFAIKYVVWAGARWIVSDVEVQSPRLLLRLGGVYNGPTVVIPITP